VKPILISQRLIKAEDYDETRECLDIRWGAFLKECGLLPISVPINADIKAYFYTLKPRGVLLTGGNDLASCNADDPISKKRDNFEKQLIKHAIETDIPLLGVCRGMQMIGYYFDLPIDRVAGHVLASHPIIIHGDSTFAPIYGSRYKVNSYHDYSIRNTNDIFKVSAHTASDDVIEGIEHMDHKIAGMMWHPERVEPFDVCDISYFKDFFSDSPKKFS
jgi:gamma-glutamyl-gamma-aminobutyrate hydrolase PuuD